MDQKADWLNELQERTRSEHTEWRIRTFGHKLHRFIRLTIMLGAMILLESLGFWAITRK